MNGPEKVLVGVLRFLKRSGSNSYALLACSSRGIVWATLFRRGGDSPPAFKAAADALAETLPDFRVVVMQGQGHAAMDTATELFTDEVLGFLGRNP
jgi:pimeloyl-ACP methyl ester carboxylesterase